MIRTLEEKKRRASNLTNERVRMEEGKGLQAQGGIKTEKQKKD